MQWLCHPFARDEPAGSCFDAVDTENYTHLKYLKDALRTMKSVKSPVALLIKKRKQNNQKT